MLGHVVAPPKSLLFFTLLPSTAIQSCLPFCQRHMVSSKGCRGQPSGSKRCSRNLSLAVEGERWKRRFAKLEWRLKTGGSFRIAHDACNAEFFAIVTSETQQRTYYKSTTCTARSGVGD
ncbi:hypothetical protein HDK77DRAFT_50922 [Phyllosticta capitalensis]